VLHDVAICECRCIYERSRATQIKFVESTRVLDILHDTCRSDDAGQDKRRLRSDPERKAGQHEETCHSQSDEEPVQLIHCQSSPEGRARKISRGWHGGARRDACG
jgi:hypothetical protein